MMMSRQIDEEFVLAIDPALSTTGYAVINMNTLELETKLTQTQTGYSPHGFMAWAVSICMKCLKMRILSLTDTLHPITHGVVLIITVRFMIF